MEHPQEHHSQPYSRRPFKQLPWSRQLSEYYEQPGVYNSNDAASRAHHLLPRQSLPPSLYATVPTRSITVSPSTTQAHYLRLTFGLFIALLILMTIGIGTVAILASSNSIRLSPPPPSPVGSAPLHARAFRSYPLTRGEQQNPIDFRLTLAKTVAACYSRTYDLFFLYWRGIDNDP
jgi:hypothetical protein